LDYGADVNCTDSAKHCPLHWVAREGRASCLPLLLNKGKSDLFILFLFYFNSLSGASVNNRSEKGQTPYDYALACRNDIAEMLKPDAPSPRPITPRATSLSNPQPQSPATPSMGTSLSTLNGSSPSPASLRLSPRAHNQIHIDDFLTEDGIMNWLERNGLGVYKQVPFIRKTVFS